MGKQGRRCIGCGCLYPCLGREELSPLFFLLLPLSLSSFSPFLSPPVCRVRAIKRAVSQHIDLHVKCAEKLRSLTDRRAQSEGAVVESREEVETHQPTLLPIPYFPYFLPRLHTLHIYLHRARYFSPSYYSNHKSYCATNLVGAY